MSPVPRTTFVPMSVFVRFSLSSYGQTRVKLTTWRYNLDLWLLKSLRMSVMRVIVLRMDTEFEVRRPSCLEDTADFRSRHLCFWWSWLLTFRSINGVLTRVMGFLQFSAVCALPFESDALLVQGLSWCNNPSAIGPAGMEEQAKIKGDMTREWYNVCQKTRPDVSRNCASCLRNNGTRKTPLSFVGHVFIFVLVYSFILCQSSTSNLGRRWAGIGQPAKALGNLRFESIVFHVFGMRALIEWFHSTLHLRRTKLNAWH